MNTSRMVNYEPSQLTALRDPTSRRSLSKRRQTLPAYNDNELRSIDKLTDNLSFLRNSKFLKDLENDSVDSDIIEEELSALQEVPISTREKVAKFLQSNPIQILLCVVVLLDAGIVIAQILLDLNSVKDKLHRRDLQLSSLLKYIEEIQSNRLQGRHNFSNTERSIRNREEKPTKINRTLPKSNNTVTPETGRTTKREVYVNMVELHLEGEDEHDILHEVAHGLHFASISLLGFLVVEDIIKILAMGRTFFKHKIEIFDAVIIASSFAIDIVFLGGMSGEEGQKAAAVLVILLLWRIARVVDGIVVTVKQRQEFRIRLQKRARRIAEKKLETFEEERHAKTRQIEALKDLCVKAGVNDAAIAACAPLHDAKHVNTTLCALSSVARLSVSMTMLMSSGIYRPSILDDRILPKVFGPKVKETRKPHIDSLPIMSGGGDDGISGKQRRNRKSSSGRKKGGVSKNFRNKTVIDATEDCSHVMVESTTSSGTSGTPDILPTPDNDLTCRPQEHPISPINTSGVNIVIDKSSDAESENCTCSFEPEATGSGASDPAGPVASDPAGPVASDPAGPVASAPGSSPAETCGPVKLDPEGPNLVTSDREAFDRGPETQIN